MSTESTFLLPLAPMARRVRVPSAWLKDEADAGRVPCLKAGPKYLFNVPVVEQLLAERAGTPSRDDGKGTA